MTLALPNGLKHNEASFHRFSCTGKSLGYVDLMIVTMTPDNTHTQCPGEESKINVYIYYCGYNKHIPLIRYIPSSLRFN